MNLKIITNVFDWLIMQTMKYCNWKSLGIILKCHQKLCYYLLIMQTMKYCNDKLLEIKFKDNWKLCYHVFDWLIVQTMKYCNCHGDNCNKDWDAAAAPASGSEVRFQICQVWNLSQEHEKYKFCKIFQLLRFGIKEIENISIL